MVVFCRGETSGDGFCKSRSTCEEKSDQEGTREEKEIKKKEEEGKKRER